MPPSHLAPCIREEKIKCAELLDISELMTRKRFY
jgi:hypothetical protein